MTKLKYPDAGLYKSLFNDCDDLESYLSSALSLANFNVPLTFVYRLYLNNLDNTLNSYYKEMKKITGKLTIVDRNFEQLSDELRVNIKNIDTSKMRERTRLVK